MNIKIITVGKLKKAYIKEGVDDYCRRLSKYVNLELIEVADEKTPDGMAEKELGIIKQKEGTRILSNIKDRDFVVALDVVGQPLSTERLADFINEKRMDREKALVFVVGGSVGLCYRIINRANFVLSFSKMTFPHGLMRLILLEQLYRTEKLLRGEPYHK